METVLAKFPGYVLISNAVSRKPYRVMIADYHTGRPLCLYGAYKSKASAIRAIKKRIEKFGG